MNRKKRTSIDQEERWIHKWRLELASPASSRMETKWWLVQRVRTIHLDLAWTLDSWWPLVSKELLCAREDSGTRAQTELDHGFALMKPWNRAVARLGPGAHGTLHNTLGTPRPPLMNCLNSLVLHWKLRILRPRHWMLGRCGPLQPPTGAWAPPAPYWSLGHSSPLLEPGPLQPPTGAWASSCWSGPESGSPSGGAGRSHCPAGLQQGVC